MTDVDELLDQLYAGQERMSRDEIHRRAVSAGLAASALAALDALPEGEYAQDEVSAALRPGATAHDAAGPDGAERGGDGVPATELGDEDLRRELAAVHRTRHETFLHGSSQALRRHTERMDELEAEFLHRFPDREVDPERMREGARGR